MASTTVAAQKNTRLFAQQSVDRPTLRSTAKEGRSFFQEDKHWAADQRVTCQVDDDGGRGSGRFTVVRSIAGPKSPTNITTKKSEREPGRFTVVRPIEPTATPSIPPKEQPQQQRVPFRLIAIGSREAVVNNIKTLHCLGYAKAFAWTRIQRGPNLGEYMSILTIRGCRVP